jgi:hypothetical protein
MRLVLALALAAADCGGSVPADPASPAASSLAAATPQPDRPTPPTLAGNRVSIRTPANDTMQLDAQLTLTGECAPAGATVTVVVGTTSVPAQVTGETWQATVTLPTGTSLIQARTGTVQDEVVVTRGADLTPRATQKIRFVWHDGVDDELRKIARGTLQNPSASKVEAFVAGVRLQTPAILLGAYEGFDVADASDDSADVHTVDLLPASDDFFGQSAYDCGNLDLHQQSEVLVGTYRSAMVDEFQTWGPMRKTDNLQTRIEDVAAALGRTSAHEFGHSLGFVGSDQGSPCGWMMGCDGGHNCADLAQSFARAERFGSGRFIMDPGGKTLNHYRLAESTSNLRGPRAPSVFTAFDRSYLAAIHPRP